MLTLSTGVAVDTAEASPETADPSETVLLPRMTIRSERLDKSLLIPKEAVRLPDFARSQPHVVFPHRAWFENVFDGRAVVGVMLDAQGKPVDTLLLKYTRTYFGEELVRAVRNETFSPRQIHGVAVPGRFQFAQRFYASAVTTNAVDAAAVRFDRLWNHLSDGPPFLYAPHLESEIDGRHLELTAAELPKITSGATKAPEGVKVIVSFYVDEQGNTRLPNVESDTDPRLIPDVIRAVSSWKFTPPKFHGAPALVFAVRSITLESP